MSSNQSSFVVKRQPIQRSPPCRRWEASPVSCQSVCVEGTLELTLSHNPVDGGLPDGHEIYVGGWVGNEHFSSCLVGDNKVALNVNLCPGDPDLLKLKVYLRMEDPETQLVKAFPLVAGVCCLRGLAQNKSAKVELGSVFNESLEGVLHLELKGAGFDPVHLKRSAMYGIGEYSAALEKMSSGIMGEIKSNAIRVPAPADGFVQGKSFLSNPGSKALGIPPAQVHYAGLSQQVGALNRPVHLALLAYFLQVHLVHNGMGVEDLLGLSDEEFSKHIADVCNGGTKDAGTFPYERDASLDVGLSLESSGKGVALTVSPQLSTSEDVGNPFTAGSFLGVKYAAKPAPPVPRSRDPVAVRYQRAMAAITKGKWEEQGRWLLQDDCETLAMGCKMIAATVERSDMSAQAFRTATQDFRVFASWTDGCYEACGRVFTRAQGLFRGGAVKIELAVGLAGGASAGTAGALKGIDEQPTLLHRPCVRSMGRKVVKHVKTGSIDAENGLGGHCFMTLSVRKGDGVSVGILEGTTSMKMFKCEENGPVYTVQMVDGSKDLGSKELAIPDFATMFGKVMEMKTQVANVIVGEPQKNPGLVAGMRGFVRNTLVLPALDSPKQPESLPFYAWCFFTGPGLALQDCVGVIPVDEHEFVASKQLGAGCRPVQLGKSSLRALGASLSPEHTKLGADILDEVWAPNATREQVHTVMGLWEEMGPLTKVGGDVKGLKKPGVEYITVVNMESPAAPECVGLVCEVKSCLVELANSINSQAEGSDGIFGMNYRTGTGVATVFFVPLASNKLTYVSSLNKARAQLGWKPQEAGQR